MSRKNQPYIFCPSVLFTVTRRVTAASTPDYTKHTSTHTMHDHRHPFQITTLHHPTPAGIHKKNDYSCLPIYSDGGCEQPGETVEEIEMHEQASLQEHSVLRKPVT
jgi:hypothetical protein